MPKLSSTMLVTVAIAFVAGCGEKPPDFVPVEGTVTLKGQPLENIRVEFWPFDDGPQSAALTDSQGRFALLTWDGNEEGAILGRHKVILRDVSIVKEFVGRGSDDYDVTGGQKPRIAEKYSNAARTPLEVEITGEKRDIAFEVEPYTASNSK